MLRLLILLFFCLSCSQNKVDLKFYKELSAGADEEVVSGGSGIVSYANSFYIIRDNSNDIYEFDKQLNFKKKIRLFAGKLPEKQKARKKKKPDLEAILLVKRQKDYLLLIPSGSKKRRYRGIITEVSSTGINETSAQKIDFRPLYKHLKPLLGRVNIEGAVAKGNELLLFQRGNTKNSKNAVIFLDYRKFINANGEVNMDPNIINKILYPKLSKEGDVQYTFTDAYLYQDHIVYLAAAEATVDAYLDGDVSGIQLGVLDFSGNVIWWEKLEKNLKFEGIAELNSKQKGPKSFLLVSDADSDKEPAQIYEATIKSM